jgi:hypothetical protein
VSTALRHTLPIRRNSSLQPNCLLLCCQHWYAARFELSALACAPLFMLQRCTILLWPWSMKFGDGFWRCTVTTGTMFTGESQSPSSSESGESSA